MYQILLLASRLDEKMKKDLVNDLKEKVNDLHLFERVMKLNQKNIFCIKMKKVMKVKQHFYEQ
jgi:hypothetical protein